MLVNTQLPRYGADVEALQQSLTFPYSECCTRSKAVNPKNITQVYR
jgi:hypothetical protein